MGSKLPDRDGERKFKLLLSLSSGDVRTELEAYTSQRGRGLSTSIAKGVTFRGVIRHRVFTAGHTGPNPQNEKGFIQLPHSVDE